MSDERWSRLRELFDEVRGMGREQRQSYLDRELAGDPDLRAELDALLAADATAGPFLTSGGSP